ncbi:hypothetical protein WMF39_32895 [Sorangium sp. So ce1504]|uniref:hypothetical protein n=1 Tax=Sorangium sp. So ce1504 TaxID=3133337 RepID=UPI003F61D043
MRRSRRTDIGERGALSVHLVEFGRGASDEQIEREFGAAPRRGPAVEADADDG